jgi:hypothetical protein
MIMLFVNLEDLKEQKRILDGIIKEEWDQVRDDIRFHGVGNTDEAPDHIQRLEALRDMVEELRLQLGERTEVMIKQEP